MIRRRSPRKTLKQVAPFLGLAIILGPHLSSIEEEASALGAGMASAWSDQALPPAPPLPTPATRFVGVAPLTAAEWFISIRPRCTPAAVTLATDRHPAPSTVEGEGFKAVCFALARKLPNARAVLLGLDESNRAEGASVVYEVARSMAAEGHQLAAGPLVELVVEFWPNHYLALHQAGSTRHESGDRPGARSYLERFLAVYSAEDSLTADARRMLDTPGPLMEMGPA